MWLLFGWGVLFLFVDDAEEFSESEALPAEEDEYDDVFLVSGVLLRNSERFSDKPVFDLYDVPLFNFLGLVNIAPLAVLHHSWWPPRNFPAPPLGPIVVERPAAGHNPCRK